jgi:O-antigen/teichoic acid export membrane protein
MSVRGEKEAMLNRLTAIVKNFSPGLRKILGNIGWLFAERFLTMAITFSVGIYVIRYLGANDFGKLSYSISIVAIFTSIANLGLNGIVIREIVREEKATAKILGTAFALKLLASALAIVLVGFVLALLNNNLDTRTMTLIIAGGLLLSSFDVIEFWFDAQVLSGVLAILRTLQIILSAITKLVMIALHAPLIAFAWLVVAEQMFKVLSMTIAYRKYARAIGKWRVYWSRGWEMLRDSWPLLLSSSMILIYMKIDQVMLGDMTTAEAVGNYAAAVRFSEVWYFIPVGICSSIFPTIYRTKQRNEGEYYARLQLLYDLMAWIAIAIALPMTLISTPLMVTLLGDAYSSAGKILIFHIWSGLFVFLGHAQHQWLMAENINRFSLAKTSLGAISNILLNLWLIPSYQGVGAAIATTLSYFIYSHISCLLFPALRENGWMLTKAMFAPFRIKQNLMYIDKIKKMIIERV